MTLKLLARDEFGRKLQVDQTLIGAWIKGSDTVPANSSKNIDINGLATFNSLDYYLTFYNEVEEKSKKLQLNALKVGNTVIDSINNRLGNLPNLKVRVYVLSSIAYLEIVNDNNYEVSIGLAKLVI